MDSVQLARDLAMVALRHEPEKVRGGSEARREWLSLVLHIQMLLVELFGSELVDKAFRDRLVEGEDNGGK